MIEGNLLIRASAGTGKTFSLATRFIRLLMFDGVSPESIVALTFSRAAAQEIYAKILERLWKAAMNEQGAAAEKNNLLAGFSPIERAVAERTVSDWSATTFARLLRRVIDAQHTGSIATLDSFILRIVCNFPLELGFQNAVAVLDGPGEREALRHCVEALLARTANADEFVSAFIAAQEECLPRTISSTLTQVTEREGWRAFVLEHPDCPFWSAESMASSLGIEDAPDFAATNAPPMEAFLDRTSKSPAAKALVKVAEALAKVPLGENPVPSGKTIAAEVIRAIVDHPDEPFADHAKSSGEIERYEFSREAFAAAHRELRRKANAFLFHLLQVVEAKIRLIALIEREYDLSTRRQGQLTFKDFTDYSAVHEDSDRFLDLQNLEFRFDSSFDHWALDEFQDTSVMQWRCLRRLVESAASSGDGRTVIAVGDLKQSIYTWRGGDEAPFREMMGWGAFRPPLGRITDSCVSHRYRQNICTFLNAVFGPKNLRAGGLIPLARGKALARWLAPDCWKDHESERDASGRPKDDDFVEVIGVPPTEEEISTGLFAGMDRLLPVLHERLARLWNEHEKVGSGESVGVLVRANSEGKEISDYLRAQGLPIVWEGLSAVSDVPAVKAVVCLLQLADHPGDTFAWAFVHALLPVREILFPEATTPEEVSRRVADSLAFCGLARTLKEYCGSLGEAERGLDELSRLRLKALVRAGVDYERRKTTEWGVDGFVRFLAESGKRESSASAHEIRVLTIHRSKGLTLDRVFVPICESDQNQMTEPKRGTALSSREGAWALPSVPASLAPLYPPIAEALERQRDERVLEALRTYYVALTRARRAMCVIVPTDSTPGKVHFRDLILKAVGPDYRQGTEPPFTSGRGGVPPPPALSRGRGGVPPPPALSRGRGGVPPPPVRRLSPSALAPVGRSPRDHLSAATLFGADFGEAARSGDREHERYAAIEWAEGETLAALPPAFRPAFVRPDPSATVWRERSYERFYAGTWESGRFDRVVFSGSGANRRATVYDFKTNRPRPDEEEVAFVQRMKETYCGQMGFYRRAVAALTGLPAERIDCVLLLISCGRRELVRNEERPSQS